MYRILIQSKLESSTSPAVYQYLIDSNGEIFESDDISKVLDRYEKEMSNYKKAYLSITGICDVKFSPSSDDCSSSGSSGSESPSFDVDIVTNQLNKLASEIVDESQLNSINIIASELDIELNPSSTIAPETPVNPDDVALDSSLTINNTYDTKMKVAVYMEDENE